MNTRKFPRTLQDAFGPYTSRDICDPAHDYTPAWYAWMAAIAAVATVVIVWTA